jgi:uncharacterized protein
MKLDLKRLRQMPDRSMMVDQSEPLLTANRNDETKPARPLRFTQAVQVKGHASGELDGRVNLNLHISTEIEVKCDRCLVSIALPIVLDQELTLCEEPSSGFAGLLIEEFSYSHGTKELELMPYVKSLIVNSLELKYLCKPDCKGLCPHCGHDLNQGSCGCAIEEPSDPRLAVLKELLS